MGKKAGISKEVCVLSGPGKQRGGGRAMYMMQLCIWDRIRLLLDGERPVANSNCKEDRK